MALDFTEISQWIADDPDPVTAAELTELVNRAQAGDAQAEAELTSRFSGFLQFGTAGLRGPLGGGPARMNRGVVIRTAAGLMRFLTSQTSAPVVAIGYDARYGSEQFARDTAQIVVNYGGKALLLPRPLPTPVLAYAVRRFNADAGVMVTASHNPPEDNGYKVYLGGRIVGGDGQGAQIVPPYDGLIASQIAAVSSAKSELAGDTATPAGELVALDESLWEEYLAAIIKLAPAGPRELSIVTTAMHGVGDETLHRVLTGAGFNQVATVAEQATPDPDFPTVNFPNPEEPGALDLAFKTGQREAADLIIANDPDADRCSAAIPDPGSPTGWRQLTGDEIGWILGAHVASTQPVGAEVTLANSIVSSRMLSQIAADAELGYQATLTGFKWIARAPSLAYGYEEAIGYCVAPDLVRDKDGISAGLLLAVVAAQVKAQGKTLADVLDELALKYGLYATAPLSIRVADLTLIGQGMANLRANPPSELAGSAVVEVTDLSEGSPQLPPTDGMLIRTAADDRVIVRPSGTEPKLKCYLEVILPLDDAAALPTARGAATDRLTEISGQIRDILGI